MNDAHRNSPTPQQAHAHGEYEAEATWSTRKFTPLVMQHISVAMQIAAVSEIRQALGMSLAFGRRRE